jgi:hypothetical protein
MTGNKGNGILANLAPYKFWFVLLAILIMCFAALTFLVPSVSANIIYYGTELNYSVNVLPNNSYVHQGENISQGYWYDLSGVFGFSGVLASWDDSDNVGYTPPDHLVSITISPRNIYIDPIKYPVGRWYQLDSYGTENACNGGNVDNLSLAYSSFRNGNNYVFAVVAAAPATNQTPMVNVTPTDLPQHTYHATAYIFNGNQTVPIDFTYSVTDTPALQQPMVQDTSNRQSVEVPTTEQTTEQPANSGVEIVTPRTPLPTSLAVISVVAGIVIWRRRND